MIANANCCYLNLSCVWIAFAGDIGYYDNEGFVFIVDRAKELIKCKGMQVSSHIAAINQPYSDCLQQRAQP